MPTETKLFEVRDVGTTVPMLAVRIKPDHTDADYVLRRAGYGISKIPYTLLVNLVSNETRYDPYEWSNSRTFTNAHLAIENRWEELASGDVVDVEFELGETLSPKTSDRQAVPS